jgi:uncharacterized protein (TIGR02145 family)
MFSNKIIIFARFKISMKKSIYIYLYISLTISLNGQFINSQELDKIEGIKRNTSFKLEEIKVRWKKAALENCLGVPCLSFTCGTSTITDIDNNTYSTVSIGTQCWTTTNLKVTKYNDGTLIGDSTNSTWGTAVIGARTGYDVSVVPLSDYVGTFGYLYNWYAVSDTRKLCPEGWHVPTDSDWNKLVKYIHSGADTTGLATQSTSAGTNLKENNALWNPNRGTNTSGFSGLPGGFCDNVGSFFNIRLIALFWSATQNGASNSAWYRNLYSSSGDVYRGDTIKSVGASVRCLRD